MGSADVVKGPFSSAIWDIQLHNVYFSYDSRKDHIILNGLNLDIPKGRTMALVGM
jgi:ABC-type multidrug transport system fused ATPase/permease subunit